MEALQWANNKLKKAGVDSSMLDTEILLALTLDESKAWLFAHFGDKLKVHHEERFRELIARRATREPVAYILGHRAFYGREFSVNRDVLIPRPETETLIESALATLKDHDPERTLICDIGTGSGAIAITLALETHLPVIAIEIDQAALAVAKQNAQTLMAGDAIDFQHGSLAEPLIRIFKTIRGQNKVATSSTYPFSHLLIAANLPYLPEMRMESVEPEVRDHEPRGALVAGESGLDAYRELIRQLTGNRRSLPRRVTLLVEIDPEQRVGTENLVTDAFPKATLTIHKDLQGLDRIIEIEI